MSKVAILGASSGIGHAVARLRLEAGDEVHAMARSADKLRGISSSDCLKPHALDARNEAALVKTLENIGVIDHLVLTMNAGSATGPINTLTVSEIRQAFENKYFPYVAAIIAAEKQVTQSITFVTGAAARAAFPGMGVLASTNSALHGLIGVLALELAPRRVNAVSPGVTDTPYWEGVPSSNRSDFFETVSDSTPIPLIGTAEEIDRSVSFLMDHQFPTGAVLDCDGGARLK